MGLYFPRCVQHTDECLEICFPTKKSEMFKTMERPRKIYCDVALQIEDAIVSGELREDEILPSERSLAITFGISQRTLREALRIL